MPKTPTNYDSPEDCENTWYSLSVDKPGGAKFGSLVHHARAGGYRGTSTMNQQEAIGEMFAGFKDMSFSPELERLRALAKPNPPIVFRTEDDMRKTKAPEMHIKGLLVRGQSLLIHAQKDHFKSFIADELLLSIATGIPAFGNPDFEVLHRGPVIKFMAEGAPGFERQRLPAWRQARGIEGDIGNIHVVRGVPHVGSPKDIERYLSAIAQLNVMPAAIGFDPYTPSMVGLNTNLDADVMRYTDMINYIIDVIGCTVIVVAHDGKDKSAGARGSAALADLLSNVATMEEPNRTHHSVTLAFEHVKDFDLGDFPRVKLYGAPVELPDVARPQLVFNVRRYDAVHDEGALDWAVEATEQEKDREAKRYYFAVVMVNANGRHLSAVKIGSAMVEAATADLASEDLAEADRARRVAAVAASTLTNWVKETRLEALPEGRKRKFAYEPLVAACVVPDGGPAGFAFSDVKHVAADHLNACNSAKNRGETAS